METCLIQFVQSVIMEGNSYGKHFSILVEVFILSKERTVWMFRYLPTIYMHKIPSVPERHLLHARIKIISVTHAHYLVIFKYSSTCSQTHLQPTQLTHEPGH